MKFCLTLPLILSAGLQIVTTFAQNEEKKSLRRGLASGTGLQRIVASSNDCLLIRTSIDHVVTAPCTPDQRLRKNWTFKSGTKQIINEKNGKCLDLSTTDENKVITDDCNDSDTQKWKYDKYEDRIENLSNDKCMKLIDSNDIQVANCDGNKNFQFTLEPDEPLYGPVIVDNECVEMSLLDNNVSVQPCQNLSQQQWYFNPNKEIFKNKVNRYCLDLRLSDGNVVAFECNNQLNQKWKVNQRKIKSLYNNNCLNVSNKKNVNVKPCDNSLSQSFSVNGNQKDPPTKSPTGSVSSTSLALIKTESTRCLETLYNNVFLGYCDDRNNQKWSINHSAKEIRNVDNHCLQIEKNGYYVFTTVCNGNENQQWKFTSGSIKNIVKGKCLSFDSNSNVHAVSCNYGPNQYFFRAPTIMNQQYTPSPTPPSPTGDSYPIKNGGNCLEIFPNQNAAFMRDCDGGESQKWVHSNGLVKNTYYNKCLDVDQSNDMGYIIVWDCHGRENQKWELSYSTMKSLSNGQCATTESNNSLRLYPCNGDQNQQFYHSNTEPPPNDEYKSIKDSTSQCVDMSPSGQVFSASCTGSQNQKWYFDTQTKTIKNESNRWCLDVDLQNDSVIIAWKECHGRNNQQWSLDGNKMKSLYNDECVKLKADKTLKLLPCNGEQNQKFYYGESPPPQTYKPITKSNDQCVDMTVNEGNIFIASCNGTTSQNWYINTETKTIKNESNEWCLDVDQQDSGNIIAWKECHGRTNQQWVLDARNAFKSMLDDKGVMTVDTNDNIFLSEYVGGDTQKFSY